MTPAEYAAVPEVDQAAPIDPHWQDLRWGWGLPESYMPPVMPGAKSGWMRLLSWLLIALFVTATTGGICLTYGPGNG